MKPWETLATARTPDGTELVLARRGEELVVRAAGQVLMSSRQHGSEERMAELGCAHLADKRAPRVLVGGLGLGFTLRAALDRLPPGASVLVCELVPELVDWNRGVIGPLAGHPLDDPRVAVEVGDVYATLAKSRAAFDAVLLDVDNGPAALTSPANARLYGKRGIELLRDALAPGGVAITWSAAPDPAYASRLSRAGLKVSIELARAAGGKGARHTLFVARRY